jgi:carboxypeptidase Taq
MSVLSTGELYTAYKNNMQKIADVKYSSAVLQWDQETYLPAKGADARGRQLATLSELAHQLFTSNETGDLLKELVQRNDLNEDQRKNAELSLEDFTKQKKYGSDFVRALTEQTNKAFHSWIEARKQNSFAVFAPELDKLVQLKKQETEILGYTGHAYNALLDEFEKGCTVDLLDKTFTGLMPQLKNLLDQITAKPQVDDSFLNLHYSKQQQWDWGMYLIQELGFDFEAGRQDISEHPFTTNFASNDVRITTRIDEEDFSNMTWSCIHETGHALYEQGLPYGQYGLPLGEYASLSIHESQSRLWENNVGRSLAFWKHYFPELQKRFPEQLKNINTEQFYRGINKVQPSLIRTEADELTYHFHVYIRYLIERQIIEGSITTNDIPSIWNEEYKKYLGVSSPDDKQGCLQDVHWSHGSFGYFPTYSLGSLYAAQFFKTAVMQLNDVPHHLEKGNTSGLLLWLRDNIHQYGRKYKSEEICRKISGTGLDIALFVEYLLQKYRDIYNL